VFGAVVGSKLVLRFAPRQVAVPGMLVAAVALLWLSSVGADFNYITQFLPAVFLLAFGFALGLVSLTLTAVKGVKAQDSGIASALLNASQQIGVAFGLAVLSTVSVRVTSTRVPDALVELYRGRELGDAGLVQSAGGALIHGYSTALMAAAGVLVVAAVIAGLLVNARKDEVSPSGKVPVH
jgi:hypothetical protein